MRYPMKLSYVARERIWGGDRLIRDYGKRADTKNLGETWELTVRPDGMSLVENGRFAGQPLDMAIAALGNGAVSPDYDGGHFPLLIKLIDATDRLSVQVHPDDAYAAMDGDAGKTEMWYVVDAEPGAQLVYGLRKGVDATDFSDAVAAGRVDDCLNYIPVKRGDIYFIPSGLVHAIGGGILIAEIQQNSDLTYRVYDYDRRDAAGNLRELHIEKALDVVRPFSEVEIDAIRYEARTEADGPACMAHCRYFRAEHLTLDGEATLPASDRFVSLLCIGGSGEIRVNGAAYPVALGESWFLPAGMGDVTLTGDLELILSSVA